MRRWLALVLVLVAVLGVALALTRQRIETVSARLWEPGQMLVVVLPEAAALDLVPGARQALGVSPSSRKTADFFTEISTGAPHERVGSGPRGRLGALAAALTAATKTVVVSVLTGTDAVFAKSARDAFEPPGGFTPPPSISKASRPPDLLVVAALSGDQVAALEDWSTRPATLILGVPADERTPLRILAAGAEGGLLGNGIARRPGIATPYDVATTVLAQFDLRPPSDFVGRPLHVVRGAGGPGTEGGAKVLDDLARRLARDAGHEQSLTAYTVSAGIGLGGLVPLFLTFAGKRRLALRAAGGGVTASAGYLIAQFIPSPRGDVRALAVGGAFVAGAILSRKRDPVRWAAGVFGVVAFATAVLAVWAALRPAGEPALSLWGNPLESWRFYGLRNFQVAFLCAGAVVGAAALGARSMALAVLAGAAALIAGAPDIGANYVGVLTLVFGAALAVFVLARGGFRWRDAAGALLVGGAAFVGALIADTGTVSSHGGRAAERISDGGMGALLDVVRNRLAVNGDKILSMPGGPLWVLLIAAITIGMLVWAVRSRGASLSVRAAVGAGAAMTLAVMALEDSGLGAGTITAYGPMAIWIAAIVPELRITRTTGGPG
jgi:hypothetical protein